jgi:opacity protein-like surface antigen
MKKLILLVFCSFLGLSVFAQHETLFNRARVVGAFGAPIVEFGLNDQINTSVGGGGGIVIDNFFLGGYGLGSIDFEALIENDDIEQLEIGHGGFWLGYAFRPDKLVHLYSSARIGWGAVNVQLNDNNVRFSDLDKIFVVTPEIGVELNITGWFRLGATAGYRWVDGTNESLGYTDDDFSGGIGTLHFRFGWFGWRRR